MVESIPKIRANFGLWMPMRYRLVHRPGHAFERYMEVTWFGFPVLKAIDRYVGGTGMTGLVGKEATGPEIDQSANMILWAEAPLMPSLCITDERIRWEAIDGTSARLIFPCEGSEDELTVHFDPETGLIARMTALRYRDAQSGKIPWHVDFLTWQTVDGIQVLNQIAPFRWRHPADRPVEVCAALRRQIESATCLALRCRFQRLASLNQTVENVFRQAALCAGRCKRQW